MGRPSSADAGRDVDRRRFLGLLAAGAAGLTAAACTTSAGSTRAASSARASGPGPSPGAASAPARATTSSTAAAPASTAALPRTTPWTARIGEVHPAVKHRATALVQAVAAWPEGQGGMAAARRRVAALGMDPSLADACAPLVGSEPAAACQVVDAQYGGILATSSSVLVVVDQWRRHADGTVHAGGTTLDIRLVEASPRWRVVDVFPAHPAPATRTPASNARAVLSSSRIHLPHAAHADVMSGTIHASVLDTLLALADRYVVDVSIVRSGHPYYVFGTRRRSDHPRGRAVDVWALDGRPLVEPVNHPLAVAGMRLAVAHGAYNVGGPVLLAGPQYFSDQTHQDHIHLGFDV
ncbi:MAG TPA: hypothetical protein VMI11_05200 [Actinomycetes bacterium]|nr:hypothetical protein [Actinomycetes bacterium]